MVRDIYKKTAAELSRLVRTRELKPSEICESFLLRSEETARINAFIHIDGEAVMKTAKKLDTTPITSETHGLFGLPVAINDNICTKDMPTTCASKMLQDFTPPYDATVITRLKNSGAVIMGKTNMDEFAMGSYCTNSHFGRVLNPYDPCHNGRVSGGSSGGSAAAVAAGSSLFALGTDTGGSNRLSAAYCGVVGYKPSYGAVSRYGCAAYASSFDQVGPLARTVADAALLTSAIAGHDPLDAMSNPGNLPDFSEISSGLSGIEGFELRGKKIGIVEECFKGINTDVAQSMDVVIKTYESLGAHIEKISIPLIEHSLPIYYIIAFAEASSNMARYNGIAYGHRCENFDSLDSLYTNSRTEAFTARVKHIIWAGTYALSTGKYEAYYKKARIAQAMLRNEFVKVLERYDVLITPAAPTGAITLEEAQADSPEQQSGLFKLTAPVNMAGLPAVAIPCAKDKNGMPIGMQLIGRWFEDASLLRIAQAFERESGLANFVAEVDV